MSGYGLWRVLRLYVWAHTFLKRQRDQPSIFGQDDNIFNFSSEYLRHGIYVRVLLRPLHTISSRLVSSSFFSVSLPLYSRRSDTGVGLAGPLLPLSPLRFVPLFSVGRILHSALFSPSDLRLIPLAYVRIRYLGVGGLYRERALPLNREAFETNRLVTHAKAEMHRLLWRWSFQVALWTSPKH